MTTQISPNTTSVATEQSIARPTEYSQKDVISYWAEYIRAELGYGPGQKMEKVFGEAMAEYGVYLQRVPEGIISSGYNLKEDGTPNIMSGSLHFYLEIHAGIRGLVGITDYTTGMPIKNQAFIQVFVNQSDKAYADELIAAQFVSDIILRPELNKDVVRFELVVPGSNLCQKLMSMDKVKDLTQIPVVLPVEGKASDQNRSQAASAKRVATRQVNGTTIYNQTSSDATVRQLEESSLKAAALNFLSKFGS